MNFEVVILDIGVGMVGIMFAVTFWRIYFEASEISSSLGMVFLIIVFIWSSVSVFGSLWVVQDVSTSGLSLA